MSILEKITKGEWSVNVHNYKVGPTLERSVLVLTNGEKEIITKTCELGEFGGINEEDDYNFQVFAKSKQMLAIIDNLAKAKIEDYPGGELDNLRHDAIELINTLNNNL